MPWTVIFKPIIPIPALLGLGTVLLMGILASYFLRARGIPLLSKGLLALLRGLALAALLIILARPMILQSEQVPMDRPGFTILLDTSESMNTQDVEDQPRMQAAVGLLLDQQKGALLKTLADQFKVKLYGFDRDLKRLSSGELTSTMVAKGKETRIAKALLDVTASGQSSPQGILLISDGRTNEVDSHASVYHAARYLRTQKIPVWTVPLGSASEVKDVYVVARLSSSYLLADQPGSIQVAVTGTGYTDWNVKLKLFREDEYVESAGVDLRNGHAEMSFPIREEHKGLYQYRVEVEPLAGETDKQNNERSVVARVVDEKLKVLVVEAGPHWDSKFLLRALRADMNIETTSIFHINRKKTFSVVESLSDEDALTKKLTPGVAMPKSLEALNQYDCIFLGQGIDTVFSRTELTLLRDYVAQRGGSVVFFRGRPYTGSSPELAKLEPVTWGRGQLTDAHFELTNSGQVNPMFNYESHARGGKVIIRELPSMTSITRVNNHKSLAVILAQTKDQRSSKMATVAYHRYGKGKVMTIAAAGLWQWGFLPERLKEYDDIHARFWGQMIRWLVSDSEFLPGQDISFLVDRNTYTPGETIRLSVSARLVDKARYRPRVELIDPTGKTVRLTPTLMGSKDSLYTVTYMAKLQGQYKAVLHNNIGEPTTEEVRFTVYDDSLEARCVQADREVLAQLAETTGAELLTPEQVHTLPEKIEAFAELTKEQVQPRDIWDRRSVFSVLIGLFGVEWLLRRIWGLV